MKKGFKKILFILIFVLIYLIFSYVFTAKENIKKFGMYKTTSYDILTEKKDTVDVVIIGDSLVYSGVIPMEIYKDYGFTVYDSADVSFLLQDAYKHLKIANESQHPKIVMYESNIFFRDIKNRPKIMKYKKTIKNHFPLLINHTNWKKYLFSNNIENSWINLSKGYRKNTAVQPIEKKEIKEKTSYIPKYNYESLEKAIKYCEKNNIKFVILSIPSKLCYNDKRGKVVEDIAKKYNIDYININTTDEVTIDWQKETKDFGDHLNYYGAKKVSRYLGKRLAEYNLLEDHKNQKKYKDWDKALEYYIKDEKQEQSQLHIVRRAK